MSANEVVNQEVLYQLLFAFICAGAFAYLFYQMDKYVRRKGHQSPLRSTAFTSAYFISLAAGWFVDAWDPASCWNCSAANNPDYFQESAIWPHTVRFISNYLPAGLAVLAGSAAVAYLLPVQRRSAGPRQTRIPWRLLSRLCVVVWVVSTLVGFFSDAEASQQFKLGIVCWSLYGTFAYYARRISAPSLSTVLSEDQRSPVLYLRPFEQEDEIFTGVSTDQLRELEIPVRNPRAFRHGVTVEEYFAVAIRRLVGPFIALGDPQDSIPPGGAARDYMDDESWRQKFRELAARSAFIIMRPGDSDNLRWELVYIRDAGLCPKLMIVIPPLRRLLDRIGGDRIGMLFDSTTKDWSKFTMVANSIALATGEFPGPGSVVTFDVTGEALTVAQGATKPEDYVEAILAHLARECIPEGSRKVG